MIDQLSEGQFYTADFIRDCGLIESPSIGTLFELYNRPGIDPQSLDVYQTGTSDRSAVFQVKQRNPQRYMNSAEFTTSQTAVQIIPAPGRGKRLVSEYIAIRTEGSSGVAYLTDGISPLQAFKVYFSVQNNVAAANLFLPSQENAPVLFTSTQGAKPVFVAIGYHFEVIKAQKL